jgi:excisionase family DNA binding protein
MDKDSKLLETLQNIQCSIQGQKSVLTFKEAAQFMGLSSSYLYKLTSRGKIPHYKPSGKMIYFNREELERWLQQGRKKTDEEIDSITSTSLILKDSKC